VEFCSSGSLTHSRAGIHLVTEAMTARDVLAERGAIGRPLHSRYGLESYPSHGVPVRCGLHNRRLTPDTSPSMSSSEHTCATENALVIDR
jgi:hypothetical protein